MGTITQPQYSLKMMDGEVLKLSKKAREYVDNLQKSLYQAEKKIGTLGEENERLKQELMNLAQPNERLKELIAINNFLVEKLKGK